MVLFMLWLSSGSVSLAQDSEPPGDSTEKKEELPDCTDPGKAGYPECQTHPPTPVPPPPPPPTGRLSASRTTILVGETTVVSAFDVKPGNQQVLMVKEAGIKEGQHCEGDGGETPRSAPRVLAPFSTVYIGCEPGVWVVKLVAFGNHRVLDSVNITVGTSTTDTMATTTLVATTTLTTVDVPSLTGTVQPTSNRLSWTAVTGAGKYEVRHRRSGRSWGTPAETTGTEHTVSLAANETYDFQVRAHGDGTQGAAAWGEWSNTLVARTGPPPRPQLPTVVETTQSGVALSWAKTVGVASYQVRYGNTSIWGRPSAWVTLPEANAPGGDTITQTVSGLRPQTTYVFKVRHRGDEPGT